MLNGLQQPLPRSSPLMDRKEALHCERRSAPVVRELNLVDSAFALHRGEEIPARDVGFFEHRYGHFAADGEGALLVRSRLPVKSVGTLLHAPRSCRGRGLDARIGWLLMSSLFVRRDSASAPEGALLVAVLLFFCIFFVAVVIHHGVLFLVIRIASRPLYRSLQIPEVLVELQVDGVHRGRLMGLAAVGAVFLLPDRRQRLQLLLQAHDERALELML
mmetsp:Transcript_27461/g.69244  ORF Transcript_27461/g.69244 Transcript_27461/m.69244 type:complete len:217 (-) Transcript_27461:172-822(-)